MALSGCGLADSPVLDPHGPIALLERNLMLTAIGLMLIVIVPVFGLTFWFARRYRASNTRARYAPDWSYSPVIDAVVWLIPIAIVAILGYLLWTRTHALDPFRPVAGNGPPLKVEVVAQDWKWLFIYPEQNIAAVNELVLPSGRPIQLILTSDTVMNSFYIPGLAGQIFAMAGMRTKLNLRADRPVVLRGRNTQYSGRGFADQHFLVRATSAARFDAWVAKARRSPKTLDAAAYAALAKPSKKVPVSYYSAVEPNLFAHIVAKYAGPQRRAGAR
jgi:cytochrome o ubiquinol oxidase subunit 2